MLKLFIGGRASFYGSLNKIIHVPYIKFFSLTRLPFAAPSQNQVQQWRGRIKCSRALKGVSWEHIFAFPNRTMILKKRLLFKVNVNSTTDRWTLAPLMLTLLGF